jgi:hypothetical protein
MSLPLTPHIVCQAEFTDWWVVKICRIIAMTLPVDESAMTARAPVRRKPEAKLSTRCFATGTVGSGSPLSLLPAL